MPGAIVWIPVRQPCVGCGRLDWCQVAEDGSFAICRRGENPGGRAKIDGTGQPYWVYRAAISVGSGTEESQAHELPADLPEPSPVQHTKARAEVGVLDAVYGSLLGMLAVKRHHEQALMARGFTGSEIEKLGYRSKPTRDEWTTTIKKQIRERYATETLVTVPGFSLYEHTNEEGKTGYKLALDGGDSTLLPQRDRYGRIHMIQLDMDQGDKKYLPLTSYGALGSKARMASHVPRHDPREVMTYAIRLVGGVYKADLATLRSGVLSISTPSENSYAPCLPDVTALDPAIVCIAPDADARANPLVAAGLAAGAILYASHGFTVWIETWPPEAGKGIDDVIAAQQGDKIEVLTEARVWEHIREVLRSAKAAPSPGVEARLVLAGLGEQPEETALFRAAVIEAVATLDTSTSEYRALRGRVEAAIPRGALKTFDAAVAKEKEKRTDADNAKRVEELKAQGKRVFRMADHKELRDAVLDDLTLVGAGWESNHDKLVYAEGVLWLYDHDFGIFKELPDSKVKNIVAGYSASPVGDIDGSPLRVTAQMARGVLELVQADREKKDFFDGGVKGIAFTNGFVVIDPKTGTRERHAHSREHRARFAFSFPYEEGRLPEKYLALLERLCKGKTDSEKAATIACLTEHLGACIAGLATRFQKVPILLGKGGTGNSTIVEVHMAAMPTGAVSSIMPQMMENSFHLAQLAGKLLNAIDDLPKDELRNSGRWKSTITGGTVEAEHKHKPPFRFNPIAGHLLGCNALPPTSDTTRGFRRRVAVLQFTSVIEDSEINRNLKNDLIDEMPVLVPYCLEQLSKAIVRNALTIPASSDALVDNWLKMSAPVEEFYDEHLRPLDDAERLNPKLWTQARTIYEAYTRWATATGHKGYSETTFGEWLKAKLGIPLEECGRAPYKRADGRYYPLTFTDSARAEAAHREAARPATTTPEEEAELQRVIDDAAHQATEALKIANGRAN